MYELLWIQIQGLKSLESSIWVWFSLWKQLEFNLSIYTVVTALRNVPGSNCSHAQKPSLWNYIYQLFMLISHLYCKAGSAYLITLCCCNYFNSIVHNLLSLLHWHFTYAECTISWISSLWCLWTPLLPLCVKMAVCNPSSSKVIFTYSSRE